MTDLLTDVERRNFAALGDPTIDQTAPGNHPL